MPDDCHRPGPSGSNKARSRSRWLAAPGALILLAAGTASATAQHLPAGGTVTAGAAAIVQPNSSTLTINQSTSQAIINWNSFSVGRGDTVNFNQPGASASTLNRVTGATPSWVAGTINAPGTVLLVNPNGIEITRSGVVNTGSFAASTLNITDSDYLSGHYRFNGNGGSAGVINNGRINTADGGFAALLGGQVSNNGIIAARLGFVALGAGEQATLDLSGDGFLSVAVPSSELGKLVNAHGALVSNKGKIIANGGTVFLSAATAANILRNAVNIPGSVRTNTVGVHNGRIVINGGGGRVRITGRLAANGGRHRSGGSISIWGDSIKVGGKVTANGASGGTISIIGDSTLALTGTLMAQGYGGQGGEIDLTASSNVTLTGATVNVSGTTGGGTVNIGGGPHATVTLADAASVTIDAASTIAADATDDGSGGHIVVWSAGLTTAQGSFSAMGGPDGGNGGLIETSGQTLNTDGITVSASAPNGTSGSWLLDPIDLIVDGTLANEILTSLEGGTSVTLETFASGSNPSTPYGLTTAETNTAGAGDIDVNAPIQDFDPASATLTLLAANNININQTISGSAISLVMQAAGSVTVNGQVAVQNLTVVAQGNISQTSSSFALQVGGTANLTAAGNITLTPSTPQDGSFGTNGTITAGGSIVTNGGTSTGGLTLSAYNNITISGTITNSGGGTVTLQSDSFGVGGTGAGAVSFTNGATIVAGGAAVNIFYYPGSANYSSPINYSGDVTGGTLTAYMLVNNLSDLEAIDNNLGGTYALATDINANGANIVPIGLSTSDLTTVTPFTGVFDGQDHMIMDVNMQIVGTNTAFPDYIKADSANASGLFAQNNGTIRNVGISGSIVDTYNNYVGALVGINNGTISNSFSNASVAGSIDYAGGLVGENNGTITGGSYATGAVIGNANVSSGILTAAGGLVGLNNGVVEYSYATGAVTGATAAGGLVGENGGGGLIDYTYALGTVQGISYSGGLVGQNDWSGVGSADYGTIENSYAAGSVSGGSAGGLVGFNEFDLDSNSFHSENYQSATVFYSLWDADTTGQTSAFGKSYFDIAGDASLQVQYVGYVANASYSANPGQYLGNPYQIQSYFFFTDPTLGSYIPTQSFTANWYMVEGSTLPFLTAEWSTTIQNAHQLQLIDMNPTATYTLARNITYTNDGMWTSAGFSPISPASYNDVEDEFYTVYCGCTSPQNSTQFYTGNLLIKQFFDYLNLSGGEYVMTGEFTIPRSSTRRHSPARSTATAIRSAVLPRPSPIAAAMPACSTPSAPAAQSRTSASSTARSAPPV